MRPEGNTLRATPRARAASILVLASVLVAVLAVALLPVRDVAGAQEPDPSDATPSTTLADLDTPSAPTREAPLTESEKASRTIRWVIYGLLGLAALVMVATVVLWRRSRPARLLAEEAAETAGRRGLGLSGELAADLSSTPDTTPTPAPIHGPVATGAPEGSGPAVPLPTAPGSWSTYAAAATSGDPPSAPSEPMVDSDVPRPAFETAPTGSWASQGWGGQAASGGRGKGSEAPVLPQGFSGAELGGTVQGRHSSWRWNERHGTTGPGGADPAVEEADETEEDRAGEQRGEPPGAASGAL